MRPLFRFSVRGLSSPEIAKKVQMPTTTIGNQPTSADRDEELPPFSTVRVMRRRRHRAERRQPCESGAGGARRTEHKGQRQQRHDDYREKSRDARPITDLVRMRSPECSPQMVEIGRRAHAASALRIRAREPGELRIHRRTQGSSLTVSPSTCLAQSGKSRRCASSNGQDRQPRCMRLVEWSAGASVHPNQTRETPPNARSTSHFAPAEFDCLLQPRRSWVPAN